MYNFFVINLYAWYYDYLKNTSSVLHTSSETWSGTTKTYNFRKSGKAASEVLKCYLKALSRTCVNSWELGRRVKYIVSKSKGEFCRLFNLFDENTKMGIFQWKYQNMVFLKI